MSSGVLKRFYSTEPWLSFRKKIINDRMKDGRIVCENCGKQIVVSKHIQVHHTPIELTEENYKDVNISLNPDNVVVWCHSCHNKYHGRFCGGGHKRREKAVYVIYGPPCSGKTSYVIEHMEEGDIVVDMDSLYQAVTLLPRYNKPDNLKYNIFAIRNSIIDNIKTRYGGFRTAWVIGGYPRKVERERLIASLGATPILLKVSKEECYERLKQCNDYRSEHIEEWEQYITDWFDNYSD